MAVSLFDLFTIGIGPSSSHTVGPMRAARRFGRRLEEEGLLGKTARVRADLYGSLAFTGKGHGTDKAVMMGLEGEEPDKIDPYSITDRLERIRSNRRLKLLGKHDVGFNEETDLVFNRRRTLPLHSNGMRYSAFDKEGEKIAERVYYSVGGGFVVTRDEAGRDELVADPTEHPYDFKSGEQLLEMCEESGMAIHELMMENEKVWRSEEQVREGILRIWKAMEECIENGCSTAGVLPGGLKVVRRAPEFRRKLEKARQEDGGDPLSIIDWVNLFALAVNEENAAGGRVVTAPTNGAAGIIPAVCAYYMRFRNGDEEGVVRFFLTAAAIGLLYKENASISGAEVGCQGEVGSACSMAAGGLAGALGATPRQVENAAEIAMEHNLGLTCDPVGGLVQIPCIERNAIASVKAINAARMAMLGDGRQRVSLDKVIKTMRQTGADMKTKYKETSRGGLATNVIEC